MKAPDTFITSWPQAERRAFEKLVEATDSAEGRNAFLGRNPGVVNAWHFESQPINDIGESVLFSKDIQTMGIPYRAECAFLKREDCQTWMMRIMRALPLINDEESNVACFRHRSIGTITPGTVTFKNEEKTVSVWSLEIGFDLVFVTGGKANGELIVKS